MTRGRAGLRRLLAAAALAWSLGAGPVRAASLVDPSLRFRTLQTTHFVIYFHRGEDALADRLAAIAEDTWAKLQEPLGIMPPRRTHVVLADQTELSNGFATPVPYDMVFITAVAPAPTEFIGNTDDWLRLVFTHEFTHIVHLDRSESWARALRGVFGRTAYAFPNLFLPTWQIEGLATYEESRLTGEGRLHAGDFRSIVREAARRGTFEPLDRVNGGLIDWPSGNAAYAYGLGFHAYLADKYGAGTLGDLANATARRVPYTASRVFKRIYGRSLGDLWKDYEASLARALPPDGPADPATRITHDGFAAAGPRFVAPACATCPPALVYAAASPHDFPSLNLVALDGSPPVRLTRRYLGSTTGVTPDVFYFDQEEIRRGIGVYGDLYAYDRRSGHVTRVTRDERLLDPDVSPDGRAIACVRDAPGRRDLAIVRTSGPAPSVETLISAAGTLFNAPRWSPDGATIAVGRQRLGSRADVVLVDAATGSVRQVLTNARQRMATPAWRPDGHAVVVAAAGDDEPFNLYEYPVDGGPSRQLTHATGGATWPDISADGRLLAFVGYTADGFDLFTMPYPSTASSGDAAPAGDAPPPSTGPASARGPEGAAERAAGAAPYRPWATLAPTSWAPIVQSDDNGVRIGAGVSAYDVLQYHVYSASATWLAAPPGGVSAASRSVPDWQVSYLYNRWQPVFFAAASAQTSFFAGPANPDGTPSTAEVREHQLEAGVALPVVHTRTTQTFFGSVFRSADDYTLANGTLSRTRASARAAWSIATAHRYGYSVSPEDGIVAGGTVELVRTSLGADGDATTATADVRAYLPGLRRHDVVALRAAGGRSTGSPEMRATFLLGGPGPDVSPIDFDRGGISILRGFAADTFAGSHVALLNVDYRLPLWYPQRGAGTWPFFAQRVYAAGFVDAGHAWTRTFRLGDARTSVGAEFSADVVLGYVLPLTATAGVAWGHDGSGLVASGATTYVRIGRSF